jgi:hypothetical protein
MAGTPPTQDKKPHPCEYCGILVQLKKVRGVSGVYEVIEAKTKQPHYNRNCEAEAYNSKRMVVGVRA